MIHSSPINFKIIMNKIIDISQFRWYPDTNTFIGIGTSLAFKPSIYASNYIDNAEGNSTKKFTIVNPKTRGFRIFKYVDTKLIQHFSDTDDVGQSTQIDTFESEDGIKCEIHYYDEIVRYSMEELWG